MREAGAESDRLMNGSNARGRDRSFPERPAKGKGLIQRFHEIYTRVFAPKLNCPFMPREKNPDTRSRYSYKDSASFSNCVRPDLSEFTSSSRFEGVNIQATARTSSRCVTATSWNVDHRELYGV
jgi:hypothetical protein